MCRTGFSLSASVLALGLALAAPARAELTAIQTAELSMQLYLAGMAEGNALLVLAAAEMRKRMNHMKLANSENQRLPKGQKAGEGTIAPIAWTEMLDSARDLAGDDAALLGMIEDVAAEGAKGVTTGQVYSISQIEDGGEDVYDDLPFAAGEYAEVYVESADGSDLNLYVYDAEGRLVCSDTDISAISYCGWRPAEGGSFTIKVENRGQGAAGYALMTN